MGKVCFGWVVLPGAWGWPPVLFAALVGVACELAVRQWSPKDSNGRPILPGVVLSMVAGGLVLNLPTGRWIGLRDASADHPLARLEWSDGLSFVDKTILRLAVMLLGFNIPPLFRASETSSGFAVTVACMVVPVSQLAAYFATQGVGRLLRMDKEAQDMMSVGTMICGASAINAYSASLQSPSHAEGDEAERKSRSERISGATALSISSIFCASLLSLLAYRPITMALGVSDENAGLWAGLAVGDLSSSIAVGSQFGETGEVFASIAKAIRILTLAPILVLLGLRNAYEDQKNFKKQVPFGQTLWNNFPLFMTGLVATLALRVGLDAAAPDQGEAIEQVGKVVSMLNKGFFVTVTAAIGLRIKLKTLLQSWRFLVVGLVGSTSIASVSLAMVQLALGKRLSAMDDEEILQSVLTSWLAGMGAVGLSATLFLLCRWLRSDAGEGAEDSSVPHVTAAPPMPTLRLGGAQPSNSIIAREEQAHKADAAGPDASLGADRA